MPKLNLTEREAFSVLAILEFASGVRYEALQNFDAANRVNTQEFPLLTPEEIRKVLFRLEPEYDEAGQRLLDWPERQ